MVRWMHGCPARSKSRRSTGVRSIMYRPDAHSREVVGLTQQQQLYEARIADLRRILTPPPRVNSLYGRLPRQGDVMASGTQMCTRRVPERAESGQTRT